VNITSYNTVGCERESEQKMKTRDEVVLFHVAVLSLTGRSWWPRFWGSFYLGGGLL